MAKGLVVHTDFSGKQCVETSLRMLGKVLRQRGLVGSASASASSATSDEIEGGAVDWLVSWAACDIDDVSRRIMLKSRYPTEHVFSSVAARLPPKMQKDLQGMRPADTDSDEQKADSYKSMLQYLRKHRRQLTRARKAACLRHEGCMCPVAWQDMSGKPSERALTMNVSGTMCTPWTEYGSGDGLSSPHTESFHIWVESMVRLAFDVTILENSKNLPVRLVEDAFVGRPVQILRFVFGPQD